MAALVMFYAVKGAMLLLASALLISWGNPISVLLGLFCALGGFGCFFFGFQLGSAEEKTSDSSEQSETVREIRTEVVREFYVRNADGSHRLEGRVIDGDIVDERPVPAPRRNVRIRR